MLITWNVLAFLFAVGSMAAAAMSGLSSSSRVIKVGLRWHKPRVRISFLQPERLARLYASS